MVMVTVVVIVVVILDIEMITKMGMEIIVEMTKKLKVIRNEIIIPVKIMKTYIVIQRFSKSGTFITKL